MWFKINYNRYLKTGKTMYLNKLIENNFQNEYKSTIISEYKNMIYEKDKNFIEFIFMIYLDGIEIKKQ